jgi:salicylate hydroxylase
MHIAIVGGGIAGLSAAAFLSRAGYACTVYERAARLREIGAGIQVSPNATRLLHRIGLRTHLARTAVRPAAVEVRDGSDGHLIARTELGAACESRYGAPYYTVHRAGLHDGLRAVTRSAVHCGRTCVGVTEHPDRVEVRFADGGTASADLVVGADGLHSVVRKAISADPVRDSGLVAYRAIVPGEASGVTVWLGADRHLVAYPLGAHRLNVVAVVPAGEAGPEFAGPAKELAAQVEPEDRWPLYDRVPLDRWHTNRIVLVGDAAHALLPFAAQGANQAVEDAATLAACLRAFGPGSAALYRYETARIPRLARVRALVRDNTEAPDDAGHRLPARDWLYGHDAELLT